MTFKNFAEFLATLPTASAIHSIHAECNRAEDALMEVTSAETVARFKLAATALRDALECDGHTDDQLVWIYAQHLRSSVRMSESCLKTQL